MLDWLGLEVFVAAARVENFSSAAQSLNLSQPAVTQRIQSLEKQLDVELFHRQGRRVYLSEAGAFLLPMAEDLLRRSQRLEETMHSLSGQVVGHLILGCSTTSGKYILPSLLARFCERHPAVRATIQVGSRTRVLDSLQGRGVHIAFTSAPVEHRDVTYCRFLDDDVVLIAPIEHVWAQRENIHIDEILQEKLILREESSGTYHAMMQALTANDITASELRTIMTLGNSEAIIMAVEEGIGVGFVARLSAERCMQMGKIKEIPITGVTMRHTIWLAENSLQPASAPQIAFLKMLRQDLPLSNRLKTMMVESDVATPTVTLPYERLN